MELSETKRGWKGKMNVTLKAICKAKDYSPFELLKVKRDLIQYKKQGRLFFDCDILQLGWEEAFEIYFYLVPNKRSEINAFPVPLERFQLHKKQQEQVGYLKEYFESYYEGKDWNEADFFEYNRQKPFVGEKFVWYFKRSECFS